MLELSHIARSFGSHAVLQNISATFSAGALHLLGGSNGSGKSTLFKIIAGLLRPTEGDIRFSHPDPRILYVGHATFLYPNLTALENLAFWNTCYGGELHEEDLMQWLNTFGLLPFADDCPRVFSRGMAQKLSLARAFMLKPDLLLLDEPATGLDQAAQDLLRSQIQRKKEEGCCILLVSHHLEQEKGLADTVHIIEQGTLVPFVQTRS